MTKRDEQPRRGPLDRRILALAPAMHHHLAVSGAAAGVLAVAVLVQAEALSRGLPQIIEGNRQAGPGLAAWLLGAGALRAVAAATTEHSASSTVRATRQAVRADVLDHLVALPPDQRRSLGPAQVGSLTVTAMDALDPWVRSYLPSLLVAVVVPLAAGLRILGADLLSAAILAIVVPLIPIFMVLIGRATERSSSRQWEALQRLAGRFLDVLTGLPTLRLFGRADAQVERVHQVTERYRSVTMRTLRVAFLSALVLELLAALSVALVAVSLGVRLTRGSVSLSTALLVLLLTPECLLPIRRVGAAFHASGAGTDAADEIGKALALPTIAEGDEEVPAGGALVAAAVEVTDPERGVRLTATTVAIDPGELVALVGPTGAGKSTLLDVMRGVLAPASGSVAIGGVPVARLRAEDRAAALRWVPQHPSPLGSTVGASVALGHPEGQATDRAVATALGRLDLTDLAHHGAEATSGGERRRVALARALVGVELGRVRYLLVDEPTAQLDHQAGERVVAALRWAASQGVGVLAVTHDPALASAADRTARVGDGDAEPAPPSVAAATPPPRASAVVADPLPVARHDPETPTIPRFVRPDDDPLSTADADRTATLRWLLHAARPHRARLLGAEALGIATELCSLGLAATAAWLIVRASEQPNFADLAVAAVAVRTFALGKGVLRYGDRLASHDATLRLLAELRGAVVDRLTRLSPTGLPAGRSGELLTRLVDDIDRLQDLFLRVLAPLGSSLTASLVAVAVAVAVDPAAGVALLAGVLAAGVAMPVASHAAARARGGDLARRRGHVAATTIELAEHVEELAASGAAATWRRHIEDEGRAADAIDRRQARVTTAVAGLGAALAPLTAALAVAVVGTGAGLSGPQVGVLILLPLAVVELLAPVSAAGAVLAQVEASAARVLALLRRPDPVTEAAATASLPARGDLMLEDVAVGWPDAAPQVTGVDLDVAEGHRSLVTGPSGSGKSTLAATLVAFLAPTAGRYDVGGRGSTSLGGEQVRRVVTWCQQDPWFADSTLADNLRVARPEAADHELEDALRTVHLDAWFAGLPAGLDTRLEHDADAMSGGERQRLALARALLARHRAIVFDEPTAHLDPPTARAVMDDLLAATTDRAVVVIGHDRDAAPIEDVHELMLQADGSACWTSRS